MIRRKRLSRKEDVKCWGQGCSFTEGSWESLSKTGTFEERPEGSEVALCRAGWVVFQAEGTAGERLEGTRSLCGWSGKNKGWVLCP